MITVLTLLKLKPSPERRAARRAAVLARVRRAVPRRVADERRRYVPQPQTDRRDDGHAVACGSGRTGIGVASLDSTVDAPGFWAKLNMFRHGDGKTLYCDLDNVINGPIDELCALEPDPLIMLDDRRVPGLPNGSVILFDAERCRFIWDALRLNRARCEREYVARRRGLLARRTTRRSSPIAERHVAGRAFRISCPTATS
jgi:hypothetical protein